MPTPQQAKWGVPGVSPGRPVPSRPFSRGRQFICRYGQYAIKAVSESEHTGGAKEGDGNGLMMVARPVVTLLGATRFHLFAIMGYSSLMAFLTLSQNKTWQAGEHHRTKGLKRQGLVLALPDVAVSPTFGSSSPTSKL